MSHTPGPWRMEEFRKGSYLVTARNAGTAREGIVAQHVPGIANARLIAAAPELLKELREMLEYTRILRSFYIDDEDLRGKGTMIEEDIERVEALLKRVEEGGAR